MQPQDKKSIQKIAALLSLAEILEQAKIRVNLLHCTRRDFLLTLMPSKNILPIRLIETHLKKLQDAFELTLRGHTTISSTPSSVHKLEVRVTSFEKKDMINESSQFYSNKV